MIDDVEALRLGQLLLRMAQDEGVTDLDVRLLERNRYALQRAVEQLLGWQLCPRCSVGEG